VQRMDGSTEPAKLVRLTGNLPKGYACSMLVD
jgi:hypothetical protein